MTESLNKVALINHCGKNSELRFSPDNKEVVIWSRVIFFLFVLFQAVPILASGPISLPELPHKESQSNSKETKKIVKQLEDPEERQKIIKTLKALASVQEMEEKKKSRSLVSYINPFIQLTIDSAAAFLYNLEKIPTAVSGYIDYFKSEQNREDFWKALVWLPILILIGIFFERVHLWLLRRFLEVRKLTAETLIAANRVANYAYLNLFLASLYPMLFLPLWVTNSSVRRWVVGFWIVIFTSRLLFLGKRTLLLPSVKPKEEHSLTTNICRYSVTGALGLMLVGGLGLLIEKVQKGEDFFLTPLLLMSVPLFILWIRKWHVKGMLVYLIESKSFTTSPKKLASLINICIRHLPSLMLILTVPLVIDWVFFEGILWNTYGMEIVITLLILQVFLKARRWIESLVHYKIPKFQSAKFQTFAFYLNSIRYPVTKGLQWAWYLSFFAALLAIWNHYFADSLINILFHPMAKTGTTILFIWGGIYFLWKALDWFVQLHTNPQTIKGKKRQPTVFAKTFGPMLHSVARWILVLVAIFFTLESLGVDLKILVYLMSALAFAISLGSQSLVKDIINGFFALIDGSFAVGDVVTVGSHTGTVESLSLRSISLRHSDGSLQTIPFSEVGNIINKSRDYAVSSIDVATSYKTKIGTVYEALNKTFEEMTNDPTFEKMILAPLSISGVDRLAETSVHVTASIKITPDPYKYFTKEFYRRLKNHMDALKIAPPIVFQEEWS